MLNIIRRAKSFAVEVKDGIANLSRWLPIIWNDYDYDWAPLAKIMEQKLRWMAEHHERDRVVADWSRTSRQMRIAAHCLKRLREDNYDCDCTKRIYIGKDQRRPGWSMSEPRWMVIEESDEEILFKQLRHLRGWWD